MLKPQDVLVLLKLASRADAAWTYPQLAVELSMSPSELHASVKRSTSAGLLLPSRAVNRGALLEFLVHGVKYVFPPERGAVTRGTPTAHSAPPLNNRFRSTRDDMPTVWADPEGSMRGEGLKPLYPSVPRAARADARLHEWLALVDAIRAGRGRERELAVEELQNRLSR